jgi:histidine ammonia-lyase
MGMTSALKLRTIVDLAELVLSIELLAAAEGLEYRRPLKPGVGALAGFEHVRHHVARLTDDRVLSTDIENLARNLP